MSYFDILHAGSGIVGGLAVAYLMLQTMFVALDAFSPGRRA